MKTAGRLTVQMRRNGACREDGAEREWKEDSGENRGDFYGGGNFVENQI